MRAREPCALSRCLVDYDYALAKTWLPGCSGRNMLRKLFFSFIAVALSACKQDAFLPKASQLPARQEQAASAPAAHMREQIAQRNLRWGAPVFLRIFKEEKLLELWLQKPDGRYTLFKSYPICTYSGSLGPKTREGDRQAPEGFYAFGRRHLNPNSQYHLSFNLNYPNAYDRAHGYTGSYLMVHGKCVSIGCYAMGDAQIEEIYAKVEAALQNGQPLVRAHAFPFRLTDANLARHGNHGWIAFWQMMKPGFDYFEKHHIPPEMEVVDGRYQLKPQAGVAR